MEIAAVSGKISSTSNSQSPQVGAGGGLPARSVSGPTSGTGASVNSNANTTANASGSTNAANSTDSVRVAITEAASDLASAEQSLNVLPVVNQARVNSIRSAIEAGTYRIQPQKIASKLLDFERDWID